MHHRRAKRFKPALLILGLISLLMLSSCDRKEDKTLQGYIEGRFTYLASNMSGHLFNRNVNRGDVVTVGQTLFELDLQPQVSKLKAEQKMLLAESERLNDLKKGNRKTVLDSIQAQLHQAKLDRDLAKLTFDRRRKLVKSGAISKAAYDRALTDFQMKQKRVAEVMSDLAEAQLGARENAIAEQAAKIEISKAKIKRLEWELSQKIIKAPVDGLIFDTFFRKGEYVPAGQAVLVMLSPRNVYLIFYVPERMLSSLRVGQEVSFTCDGCSAQAARIYFISPNAEYTPPVIFSKDTRHKLVYRVEAKIPLNRAMQYHPGQPVDVTLPGIKDEK